MSAVPPTRSSLLLRVRDAKDHDAWQAFVQIYTPLVYGFCRKRGLQDADAADVAQEVMRAVARRIAEFEYQPEKGTFRSWLYTITRSKLNNFLKTICRQPRATFDTSVQESLAAQAAPDRDHEWDHEYHQRLFEWACDRVKREFEDSTWQAFWQTSVEGKSGVVAASSLGLSVGAVYVAKSRVLARLRAAIKQVDQHCEDDPGPAGEGNPSGASSKG